MSKIFIAANVFALSFGLAAAASAVDISLPPDSLYVENTDLDALGAIGSFSPGLDVNLSGNRVTVNDTTLTAITGNVFGGQSSTSGAVFSNNAFISGGLIGGVGLPPMVTYIPQLEGGSLHAPSAAIAISGSVFGGVTAAAGADAYSNTLTVSGGEIRGSALGGFATGTGSDVYDNKVFFSGGSVAYELNGATTDQGSADNNSVTISGGIINGWVHGASVLTGAGNNVTNNTVTVTGGQFTQTGAIVPRIYGGITAEGLAEGNTVLISNLADPAALANRAIYGGGSIKGSVDGNSIIIKNTPGFQAVALSGGYGGEKTDGLTAANNTVAIIDSNNFAIATWIRGGRLLDNGAGTSGMLDGNTFNLTRSGGRAGGIAFFENYNFDLPKTLSTASPLVTITTANNPVDLTGAKVNIKSLQSGGQIFRPGDTVTLISQAENLEASFDVTLKTGLLDYDFHVFNDDALRMRLEAAQVDPGGGGGLPSGPGAAIGFLGQGTDLIADLMALPFIEPAERRKMPTLFAVGSGSAVTYASHPELNVRGWSLVAGVDWFHPVENTGGLNLAAFFEAGTGAYDSDGLFAGQRVSSDGDLRYVGGGLLGRFDFASGWYAEGSARFGKASLDFRSSDLQDALGNRARYDYSAPYYGAHAGVGYIWRLNEVSAVDVYAKYLWVRLQGDDVSVLDTTVSFKHLDSQRARAGLRYSRDLSAQWSFYGGAGLEYEFSSKTDAQIDIYDLAVTDLTGTTGLAEVGFLYQAGGFSLEVDVKGYLGERRGLSGRLMLGYSF